MKEYFEMLKVVMTKHNFSTIQSNYNVDKIGISLEQIPPKIVAKRGQQKVSCRKLGNKSQITVITVSVVLFIPYLCSKIHCLIHVWNQLTTSSICSYNVSCHQSYLHNYQVKLSLFKFNRAFYSCITHV